MKELIVRFFSRNKTVGEQELISLLKDRIESGELADKLNCSTLTLKECNASGLSRTAQSSAITLLESAFNNEIVIVDASLDAEELTNPSDFGSNYECLTPAVMSLDNVLVLSRTQIPLNFLPTRTNVKRLGDDYDPVNEINSGKKGYELRYSNGQIISWLENELISMSKEGRLYRDSELLAKESKILEENIAYLSSRKHEGKLLCFISYRGCYSAKDNNGTPIKYNGIYGIEEVQSEIIEYHKREQEAQKEPRKEVLVKFFREGCLSNELMPEVRRWAFVSYIDRYIRECDEFWIFNTRHKEKTGENKGEYGYWDSWWCQGEILTLLRLKNEIVNGRKIKVMMFDPDETDIEKRIRPVDISDWHDITTEENKELARYYANSDFLEAGYESFKKMRRLRRLPVFLRKFKFNLMKKVVFANYANDSMDDFTYHDFECSVFSHVYDKSFMTHRILTCGKCMSVGNSEDIAADDMFIWNFLNINGTYTNTIRGINPPAGVTIITPRQFALIVNKQTDDSYCGCDCTIECANHHPLTIKKTTDCFYIWWTPRMGKRTGPNGSIVEAVQLYS